MRGKDLLECMEYIDDALIEEALEPAAFSRRNNIVAKWGMAAACVAVIGISATAFWSHQNLKINQESASGTTSQMDMNAASDNAGSLQDNAVTTDTVAEGIAYEEAADEVSGVNDAGGAGDIRQSTAEDATASKENAEIQDMGNLEERKELIEEETEKQKYTIISDYYDEKDGTIYDYPVPEKGKYFCCYYLQKTMEHYTEQENAAGTADSPIYAYDVVIEVFGDIETKDAKDIHYIELNMENTDAGNAMMEAEYRRLIDLGYAVRLSEDFQLTGTFTKVEIDTFQASPDYGYIFSFANE